jgi:hypothetical protein
VGEGFLHMATRYICLVTLPNESYLEVIGTFRIVTSSMFLGCEMKMGTRGPLKLVLCKEHPHEHPAADLSRWILIELCIFSNLAR